MVVLAVIGVAILAVLLVTTVVIPVIAFTFELLLLLVLFFIGLAGRLLSRKPWTVRTRAGGRTRQRWHIVGFRNSDEIAEALRSDRALPPATPLPR